MRGGIDIRCAYGDALNVNIALKNLAGVAIDVTGYSARLDFQKFDDSSTWINVFSLTNGGGGIAVGGINGLFAATLSAPQSTALGAFFGSPQPTREGRFWLYVTPPAGTEKIIAHGTVTFLQAGEPVAPAYADAYEDTFTVTVSALAPAGPAGPAGATGSQGDPAVLQQAATSETLPTAPIIRIRGAKLRAGAGYTEQDHSRQTIEEFGANSEAVNTTITATAGATSATLGANSGFLEGDWFFVPGQIAHGLAAPVPILVVQGTTGAIAWDVQLVAYSRCHGYSAPSAVVSVTTANATLSKDAFIEIWQTARAAGAEKILVYARRAGVGSLTYRGGFVANPINGLGNSPRCATFRLMHNTAVTPPPGVPSVVPSAERLNGMWSQLTSSLSGSNVASIYPPLRVTAVAADCYPDASPAIMGACSYLSSLSPGGEVLVPPGAFQCVTDFTISQNVKLKSATESKLYGPSILEMRDGVGMQIDGSKMAIMRQPGVMHRTGDRVQATDHTLQPDAGTSHMKIFVAEVSTPTGWGATAAGGDPTWDWTTGDATVDGEVTWRATEDAGSAAESVIAGIVLDWQGQTMPVNRWVMHDDMQVSAWGELDSGGDATCGWVSGMVSTSTNKWVFPPAALFNGKVYEATTPGTSGAGPVTWPKLNGATVADGTTVWTCRDAFWQQGVGLLANITCKGVRVGIRGPGGTGIHFNGDILTTGGNTDYTEFSAQIQFCAGHAASACGSDGHMGRIDIHVGHNWGRSFQDDSFFGDKAFVANGGVGGNSGQIGFGGEGAGALLGYQNQSRGSAQVFAKLEGYGEGSIVNRVFTPGTIGDGYNLRRDTGTTGPRTGGTFTEDVASYDIGQLIYRQMTLGRDRMASGPAATSIGLDLFNLEGLYDQSEGRIQYTLEADDTEDVFAWPVYYARGRIPEFRSGILTGNGGGGANGFSCRFAAVYAIPTTGAFLRGDFFPWALDASRLGIVAGTTGVLGATARANSTPYLRGAAFTSGGRVFVVIRAGTTASSPPAGLATTGQIGRVLDGSCHVQRWGNAADPLLYAIPDLSAIPVALADANQTVQASQGNVFSCNGYTDNRAIALGTAGLLRCDMREFRKEDAAPFVVNIGGVDALPAGERATAQFQWNGTAWVHLRTWRDPAAPGPGGDASAAWPVGSVFISVVATNPATLLGFGTWAAFGAGRVMVGLDSGDAAFDTAEETGGALTATPTGTVSQPTFAGSALGTHSHAPGTLATSAHSGTAVTDHAAHSHSYTDVLNHTHPVTDPGHTHVQNSHNHTQDSHNHTQNSHNHTQTAFAPRIINSGTAGTVGVQGASAASNANASNAATTAVNQVATATNIATTATNQATTAVNQNASTGITTGNPVGGVASGTTAGPSAALSHSVTQPAGHTLSGATEAVSAGTPGGTVSQPSFSGASMSVVQPYITCYFWKRTA